MEHDVPGRAAIVYPATGLPAAAKRHGCAVAVVNPDASFGAPAEAMRWQEPAGQGLASLLIQLAS